MDGSRTTLKIASPMGRREILDAIRREQTNLVRLDAERSGTAERLRSLQTQLASLDEGDVEIRVRLPLALPATPPATSAEKVRLFRSLFRGRMDVYPTRFVSKKTGKPGYAPACRNKFVRGVCELPKVKCGECPNQAFVPFDDAAILGHLTGRHVMGVYPLLDDETCWFLAVDFDKSAWFDDVGAFAETCRRIGLPVSVERSRSPTTTRATPPTRSSLPWPTTSFATFRSTRLWRRRAQKPPAAPTSSPLPR